VYYFLFIFFFRTATTRSANGRKGKKKSYLERGDNIMRMGYLQSVWEIPASQAAVKDSSYLRFLS
jgi:hypothetical protein